MIDIVMATCERLDCLKRTLRSVWRNTRGEYRLHVIDDASTEGNQEYLQQMLSRGKIHTLRLHPHRLGVAANLRELYALTSSALVVYCDDDQLCPDVQPDWLIRLIDVMNQRPKQAMLSLNNPHGNVNGDKRRRLSVDGPVTLCERSGGSFMCIRRELLPKLAPPDGLQSPVSWMCKQAWRQGYQNGYLTHTYTWHIGTTSMRWKNKDLSNETDLIKPVNMRTLEPPEEYRL